MALQGCDQVAYLQPDGLTDRSEFRAGYADCARCQGYYDAREDWRLRRALALRVTICLAGTTE